MIVNDDDGSVIADQEMGNESVNEGVDVCVGDERIHWSEICGFVEKRSDCGWDGVSC